VLAEPLESPPHVADTLRLGVVQSIGTEAVGRISPEDLEAARPLR
jgi:hypothetical protein